MKRLLAIVRRSLCLIALLMLVVPGRANLGHAFSIGEEREVGEKLLYAVRASFPIIGDPDLHLYLNDIGQEVLEVAGVQYFDYRFYIVDSSQFNAFAAPSGLIFFYSSLIEAMNSEDELVSVIAHEIGHIVKRHLASRIETGRIVGIASLGAALAALALGGGEAAQGLVAGSLAAGRSTQLHFSRQHETEADLLAYKWMRDMGRDPRGQKQMLETMRRIVRYRMGQVPQYLLTHPDPEARLDYVESLIAADGDDLAALDEQRDFAFLRFKYRIMSLSSNRSSARPSLVSVISDDKASSFEVVMAEYGLAQLDRVENNYERSLKRLETVIAAFPDRPVLQVDRAVVYADMGEFAKAREILETVLRIDPGNIYASYVLGTVLDRLGEAERALSLLFRVADRLPEYSQLHFTIGRILAGQGKTIESRYYLGKFNLYEGKLKLARANFKEVAAAAEDNDMRRDSEAALELIERLLDR